MEGVSWVIMLWVWGRRNGGWVEVLGWVGGSREWNGWEILEYWMISWIIYGWVGIRYWLIKMEDEGVGLAGCELLEVIRG